MRKRDILTGYLIFMIMIIALLSGCVDEEDISPDSGSKVTFSFTVDDYSAVSKSILTSKDIEDKMTSVSLFVYYKDRLIQTIHHENTGNGLSVSLENGREYDIYVLANMGDMTDAMPEDKSSHPVEEVSWTIPSYSHIDAKGIPMAGKAEEFKAGTDTPALRLTRLFAKVCTEIRFGYEGAVISGVKVMNLNGTLRPFGLSCAMSPSSIMTEVEYDSGTDGYCFYVPENMQGQIGSASTAHEKNPDLDSGINARKDLLTYMEVEVSLDGNDEYIGNVTYRSYLGNDDTRNFDLKGNCCYNWNVTYHKDNLQHNDWKICTEGMSPAVKDVLEFAGNVSAGPGQTVDVLFSYDLPATAQGPSGIIFSSDEGSVLGEPVFTAGSGDAGTGVIPVTCSTSSSIGDILRIRMETKTAYAETELEVVNYVTDVSLEIPYPYKTVMVQEFMPVNVTARYYDGTTVTDPSEFTWTVEAISAPEDIVTIDDGILKRRLDASGRCSLRADYHGIKSNTTVINVKDYYITAEFIPDPVHVEVGKDLIGYVQKNIHNIADGTISSVKNFQLYDGDYDDKTYSFSIKDGSICSVEDMSTRGRLGLILTGLAEGSTVLELDFYETTDFTSHHMEIPVIVGDERHALEMSETSFICRTGESHQLRADYVIYKNGVEISRTDVTSYATWKSLNPGVADVAGGLVRSTGKDGEATITASYNRYKANAGGRFGNYYFDLRTSISSITLKEGDTYQIRAYCDTYLDDTIISTDDVTDDAIWDSSHWRIANVFGGLVEALEEGDAAIFAYYEGMEAWTELTIEYVEGYSETYIEIIPSSLEISIGESVNLNAMQHLMSYGEPVSHSNITRIGKWSSSDSSIASVVSYSGEVTGVSAGETTITITRNGVSASIPVTVR